MVKAENIVDDKMVDQTVIAGEISDEMLKLRHEWADRLKATGAGANRWAIIANLFICEGIWTLICARAAPEEIDTLVQYNFNTLTDPDTITMMLGAVCDAAQDRDAILTALKDEAARMSAVFAKKKAAH